MMRRRRNIIHHHPIHYSLIKTKQPFFVFNGLVLLHIEKNGKLLIGRKSGGNLEAIFGCDHVTPDERRGENHAGEDDTENSESNNGRRHV